MISGALATALERNRGALNARWPERRGSDDAGRFLRVLAANLDPPVAAAAASAPERAEAVCLALFDAALVLWTRGALGEDAACDAGAVVFQRVLPANPGLLARDPAGFAGSLANAVLGLRRDGHVDPAAWAASMADAAAVADDLATLRDAGLVLAWRSGLADARDAALAAFDRLPGPVAVVLGIRAFGLGGGPRDIRAGISNRWHTVTRANWGHLDVVRFAGAHEAFGGPFRRPPEVRAVAGRLLAGHGDDWWTIHADDWGVVLRPAADPGDADAAPRGAARVAPDGTVAWRGQTRTFPACARAASWAETDDTLAVACSDSHRVRLLAIRGGAA